MIQDTIFSPPDGPPFFQKVEITAEGARIVSEPWPLDAPKPKLVEKAVSLVRAVKQTAARGPVSEPTRLVRRLMCSGFATLSIEGKPVDVQGAPCPHFEPLEDDPADGHCTACGCPEWRLSRMSVKWRMRGAPCPAGRYPGGDVG